MRANKSSSKKKQNSIANDVMNKIQKVQKEIAFTTCEAMISEYKEAIDKFYLDYNNSVPRNGLLYAAITTGAYEEDYTKVHGMIGSHKKIIDNILDGGMSNVWDNKINNIFDSYRDVKGINSLNNILSKTSLSKYIKQNNNSIVAGFTLRGGWVFKRSFEYGIHGATSNEPRRWHNKNGLYHPYWKGNPQTEPPKEYLEKAMSFINNFLPIQTNEIMHKYFGGNK